MTREQVILVEETARQWSDSAWYWLFGGVVDCFRFALDKMHLKALEFFCAILLALAGVWLIIPITAGSSIPFVHIMQASVLGSPFYVPLWLSGVLYILIARVMMHFTLHEDARRRGIWLAISATTWGIMLAFNLLSAFSEFPNGLLTIMCLTNLYLMDRAGAEAYQEVQRINGTRTKESE